MANQPIADDGALECVCYFLIKRKRKRKREIGRKGKKGARREGWQGRKEINHKRRK